MGLSRSSTVRRSAGGKFLREDEEGRRFFWARAWILATSGLTGALPVGAAPLDGTSAVLSGGSCSIGSGGEVTAAGAPCGLVGCATVSSSLARAPRGNAGG